MRIETDRLKIRDISADDWEALGRLLADREVMQFASQGAPFSLAQTHELLLHYLEEGKKHPLGICALLDKGSGEMIGYCGLEWHTIDGEIQPELVYCLERDYWGAGLAHEAATAVLGIAHEMGIAPIVSYIHEDNARSIRLAERLGASQKGKQVIHNIEKLKFVYP